MSLDIKDREQVLAETSERLAEEIDRYIDDPSTEVWLNHNDEIGEWRWSVQVCGTDMWLDSFDTEEKAMSYIHKYNLRMG